MKIKYTRRQILESIKYWQKQLKTGNYRKLNESKIGDFFGKLFRTEKFKQKQKELEKAAKEEDRMEFEKQHPLAAVARKMQENDHYLSIRFTNVDIENDGYPVEASRNADCIVVEYTDDENYRYDDMRKDEKKILELVKRCGYHDKCEFYPIDDTMAVVMPKTAGNWYIKKINESEIGLI